MQTRIQGTDQCCQQFKPKNTGQGRKKSHLAQKRKKIPDIWDKSRLLATLELIILRKCLYV